MFPAVDHIRSIILHKVIGNKNHNFKEKTDSQGGATIVIVDCLHVKKIDFTAAQVFLWFV